MNLHIASYLIKIIINKTKLLWISVFTEQSITINIKYMNKYQMLKNNHPETNALAIYKDVSKTCIILIFLEWLINSLIT